MTVGDLSTTTICCSEDRCNDGMINLFIPAFLMWTLPSLNRVRTIVQNRDSSQKSKHDEMAHYEPSHQALHCLQKKNGFGLQGLKA